MIRCNHCGKLAPMGARSCQNCGMPLVGSGGNANVGGQSGQQELPAWLESLRTHERPTTNNSTGDQQPFSMAELVDENAMPSWMRLDQARLSENSEALPVVSSRTNPSSGSEKQDFPATGFEAGSLIDEHSLPSWMRGQETNPAATGGQNLIANSLVQQEALPTWMREGQQQAGSGPVTPPQPQTPSAPAWLQQQSPVAPQAQPSWMQNLEPRGAAQAQPAGAPSWMQNLEPRGAAQAPANWTNEQQYGLPAQMPPAQMSPVRPQGLDLPPSQASPPVAYGVDGAIPPAQGFSARDLVDQQALPGWMRDAQGPGPQPQTRAVPRGSGFAAGDLVDQQSVPPWLKNQQGQGNSGPVSAMGVPVSGGEQIPDMGQGNAGGVGMPVGSLLDINSLPAWLREGEQGQGINTPPVPQENGMVAGSLIDPNVLPAWMREPNSPPQVGHITDPRSGQVRIDAGRVPSRPRGEAMQPDQSEAAANIFASMLGVSASTPLLPGQPSLPDAQQSSLGVAHNQLVPPPPMTPVQPVQTIIPGWQSALPPSTPAPGPQTWGGQAQGQMPGMAMPPMPVSNIPPAGQQLGMNRVPYSPIAPRGMDQSTYQGGYPAPGEASRGSLGSNNGTGPTPGRETQAETAKKKGFFDSIRDFFFK